MFTRILVPTDFSEPSDAALTYAKALAGKFGASLHVLHVIEIPAAMMGPEVYIADVPGLQARLYENAQNRLQEQVTPNDRTRHPATADIVWNERAQHPRVHRGEGHRLDCHGHARPWRPVTPADGQRGREGCAPGGCPVLTVRRAPAAEVRVPERLQLEWIQTGG